MTRNTILVQVPLIARCIVVSTIAKSGERLYFSKAENQKPDNTIPCVESKMKQ